MPVRVAINGFGRIGRNILRAIAESGRKDIEVVGINDLGPVETNAHLLRFDSVHGRFAHEVTVKGDTISYGNGAIKVAAERDVDAEFLPRQLRRIAFGGDLDRAIAVADGVAFHGDFVREAAMHRVEAQQVRIGFDRAEIVDADDFDVLAA